MKQGYIKSYFFNPALLMLLFLASSTGIVMLPGCSQANAADQDSAISAFKYREVYLPEGIGKNADAHGLNSLEEDWGIWGHNLAKVVPEEHSQSIFAKQNGNTLKKQFCFSSNHLYEYIEEYIDNKYDDTEVIRFAIVPNDNDIVCLCEKCVAVGNTRKNAGPAVEKLVRRLAARFPNHIFYTSDYRTTKSIPTDSMPTNSGVLVSAMTYPLTNGTTPDEARFMQRLQAWGATTPRILVWDYINNFDDYFTPFPTLGAMQRRLKNYKDNKVTAVFLNGSGADASSMSRLKTAVLAELTANPDVDWKEVLKNKAAEIYPVTGELISGFMIAQEDSVAKTGAILPLYEGVEDALTTYLPENLFVDFHDKLLAMRDETSGDERAEVDKLLGQLALTRLEIKRINGDLRNAEPLLADLQNLISSNILGYNESGWTIEHYIRDYNYILKNAKETMDRNKLHGEKLVAMTPLDPDYSDISILTDGVLGMPSNYHNGNLITSPEHSTQIAVPRKPGMGKLKVWMTYNPAYRISLPESVTLKVGGREVKRETPQYPSDLSGHSYVEFNIPGNAEGSLVLTFNKLEDTHSMAIEEIEGF